MTKRIVFLDFVRVFACFLVILVHASENFYPGPNATDMAGPQSFIACEADRFWVSVYDGFSRMAVPLFMIVSAYLLVPMKESMSATDFYRKRAKRILPAFILFLVIYSTLPMLWGQISTENAINDLIHLPFNFPSLAGHLWFMYPLIGLYLFIPIISPWLSKAKASEERMFITLFLISTCMPYLNRFIGEVWGQCFWNEFHMLWNFSGFLGYLVLAHYIKAHLTWNNTKRIIIGSSLMLIGAIWTILSFYIQAVPGVIHDTPTIELGWAFCTINCVMLTTGTFLLFSCIKLQRTPHLIAEISNLSYGIYLMHILWLGFWTKIFKLQMELTSDVCIPAIAIATFISCYITAKIIALIPILRWTLGLPTKKAEP